MCIDVLRSTFYDGDRQLMPTYEAAMNYVSRLDASLEHIRRLLLAT